MPNVQQGFVADVVAGRIEPDARGCIPWPFGLNSAGYPRVTWRGRRSTVGRVVLEETVGPAPEGKPEAGHAPAEVCGSRACVAPGHLSWQGYVEQKEHQRLDGSFYVPDSSTGESHHASRHSDAQVCRARERVAAGETIAHVARDLGTGRNTVWRWARGLTRLDAGGPLVS